jgi:hypothetical protein
MLLIGLYTHADIYLYILKNTWQHSPSSLEYVDDIWMGEYLEDIWMEDGVNHQPQEKKGC